MSRHPGGSIDMTGRCRRSRLPTMFSSVIDQPSGGKHASTSPEKSPVGMSCSNRSTAVSTDFSPMLPLIKETRKLGKLGPE